MSVSQQDFDAMTQLAKMGRIWLELLVARQEIDPEATAITFTANMPDGTKREVAKMTLADAFRKFDDAGLDVSAEMAGLI